jgi:hypothetical protein
MASRHKYNMLLLLSDYILDDELEYVCRKEEYVPTKLIPSNLGKSTKPAILSPITVCNQNLIAAINKEEYPDWKKEE